MPIDFFIDTVDHFQGIWCLRIQDAVSPWCLVNSTNIITPEQELTVKASSEDRPWQSYFFIFHLFFPFTLRSGGIPIYYFRFYYTVTYSSKLCVFVSLHAWCPILSWLSIANLFGLFATSQPLAEFRHHKPHCPRCILWLVSVKILAYLTMVSI